MSRTALLALSALTLLWACDRGDDAPKGGPASGQEPASRPARDGTAPELSTIVAREGDHLLVIVDVAEKDAQGRPVVTAVADVGAGATPVTASRPAGSSGGRLALEVRVPAGTREIKVTGTSEGGIPWSVPVSTEL